MGLVTITLAPMTGKLPSSHPPQQRTRATRGAYAAVPQLKPAAAVAAAPGETTGSSLHFAPPNGRCAAPSGAFAEAHRLVCEGVENLETAIVLLKQPTGVKGAVKQANGAAVGQEDASMKGAGKALVRDRRLNAKKLTQKAFKKYEAAANLVDGLPKLVPVEVKPGHVTEAADAVAGKAEAGSGAANAMVSGAFLALNLASGATAGIGFIRPAVKRRRMKKAVGSVEAVLQEMRNARDWLAASAQAYY